MIIDALSLEWIRYDLRFREYLGNCLLGQLIREFITWKSGYLER